jgi:hypothetical protein
VIESEIAGVQGKMHDIDAGGFKNKGDLVEYARLNNQLFSDNAELAEARRLFRSNTPFAEWTRKDWDEAHTDVAMALGSMGAAGAAGAARSLPIVTYSSSRGAMGNGYRAFGEVTAPVKNAGLLNALSAAGKGTWEKVYEAGMMKGQQIEIHYFRNTTSGRVFDVKVKYHNWHQKEFKTLGTP